MTLAELERVVEALDQHGIEFDLRRDVLVAERYRLTTSMPSYVLCVYATEYFASLLKADPEVASESARRMSQLAAGLSPQHQEGLHQTYTPMPVMAKNGTFYIPSGEGIDEEDFED